MTGSAAAAIARLKVAHAVADHDGVFFCAAVFFHKIHDAVRRGLNLEIRACGGNDLLEFVPYARPLKHRIDGVAAVCENIAVRADFTDAAENLLYLRKGAYRVVFLIRFIDFIVIGKLGKIVFLAVKVDSGRNVHKHFFHNFVVGRIVSEIAERASQVADDIRIGIKQRSVKIPYKKLHIFHLYSPTDLEIIRFLFIIKPLNPMCQGENELCFCGQPIGNLL